MGLFQSQPVTRSDVKELNHRFRDLSDQLDLYLPWITFCRNGGVILSVLGAGNMLMRSLTLYRPGGDVGVQLFLVALVMQAIGSLVCREAIIIRTVEGLLDRFFKSVPGYMDTSSVPAPARERGLAGILVVANLYSYLQCLHMADGFHINLWGLLASVVQVGLNGLFLLRIVRTRNDANLQTICRRCRACLEAVVQANADPCVTGSQSACQEYKLSIHRNPPCSVVAQ